MRKIEIGVLVVIGAVHHALSKVPARADDTSRPLNKYEQYYRLINSIGVQFVGGDLPGLTSMVANSVNLPPSCAPYLNLFNVLNAATGYLGIAADLRVNYDALKNPNATRTDIAVDWAHFVVGDVINTGASMIPLFVPLAGHPLAYSLFMGGQGLGALCDLGKVLYDYKRHGQQSALPDAHAPHRLVLDRVEKAFGSLSQATGVLGLEALILGGFATLAPILATLGGSFGAVAAINQVTKGRGLTKAFEAMKAEGAQTVDLPSYTSHGLETRPVDVDEAIHKARNVVRWGLAQGAVSALMMAAGIVASPVVATVAMGASVAVGAVATGLSLYHNRHRIADGLRAVGEAIEHKLHPDGEAAGPLERWIPAPPCLQTV